MEKHNEKWQPVFILCINVQLLGMGAQRQRWEEREEVLKDLILKVDLNNTGWSKPSMLYIFILKRDRNICV